MRLVKIASYYKAALEYYYSLFPDVKDLPYQEQLRHLLNFGLGWSDFYSRSLRQLGWEAYEIIANSTHLQKKWAQENNFHGNDTAIVLEQIRRLKPDIVWFQDSISFNADFFRTVKSLPFVKIIIGNSCAPYSRTNLQAFKVFDFITTCSPKFVKEFSQYDIKTLLLYQAFEPDILNRINNPKKEIDVIFIGSLLVGQGYHNQRINLLKKLVRQGINIRIHANIKGSRPQDILKKQVLYLARELVNTFRLDVLVKNSLWYRKSLTIDSFPPVKFLGLRLSRSIRPPVFGLHMFQTLSNAKICLNHHVGVAGEYAANMRMFEATGVGTLLLTDNKRNIKDLFVPDREVVVYDTFDQAIEKLQYLLDHPDKAMEIARAGQKRTLQDHTYQKRTHLLINEIQKYL